MLKTADSHPGEMTAGDSNLDAAPVELRAMAPGDAHDVAEIVYTAFADIHDRHQFPRDFPTRGAAVQLVESFIAHPSIWGVVAVREGRVVGSNFLDERGPVRGVGPITVDPGVQGGRVGRGLMDAVIERGVGADGIRLLQDSFNVRSLALYASLGFRVTDPVALMSGRPQPHIPRGYEVRPMTQSDLEEAAALHIEANGFERTRELGDALRTPGFEPFVAVRDGDIVAYATTLTFFPAAHAIATSTQAMAALVTGVIESSDAPASFLLPTRQHQLFRWALEAGLRVVKPMTYLVLGRSHQPQGAWIPSVLY
jgi:predicted N-acetyltransferase YhbS